VRAAGGYSLFGAAGNRQLMTRSYLINGEVPKIEFPQGLKPRIYEGMSGTAEAVPFQS